MLSVSKEASQNPILVNDRSYTFGVARSAVFELASEALRLVQVDPGRSVAVAQTAAVAAGKSGEPDAASVAERALGLAAVHLKDLDTATRHLRAAVTLARRAKSVQLVAQARMTFAFALNRQGRSRAALAEIGAALDDLDDLGKARGLAQRGAILQQLGRHDEAVADYRVALPILRQSDDLVWVQRVLSNRGVLHAFRHEYGAATDDLLKAERLCQQLGLTLAAAFVQENLLLVQRRLGDVPRSLTHLARAEQLYRSLDTPTGSLLLERSELLVSMRLFGEALAAGQQAVAEFERTGRRLSVPEARLLLARVAVLSGDPSGAVLQARAALTEFSRQLRAEWVALARCELILARHAAGQSRGLTVSLLTRAATAAEAAGWSGTALEVRLLAGRLGLARRDRGQAVGQLELVSGARLRGPAAHRARGWYAAALLRQEQGDRPGALRAAASGLRIIDEYCNTIAATDLRASISGLGVDLAQLGLRDALAHGSARQVLEWAERGRARQLLQHPAAATDDPEAAQLLAELRSVVADLEERRRSGQPVGQLARHQVALEREVRDATRRRASSSSLSSPGSPNPAELTDLLAGAALVEFVELDGSLYAVCVVPGRIVRYALGSMAPLRDMVRWLSFALLRLARQQTSQASAAAAMTLLGRSTRQLDDILLRPLAREIAERPVVIVPTGVLQSMPWSLLPSAVGRPLTVCPSAALWHRGMSAVPEPGNILVVAGPGLPGAQAEASEVAAVYGTGLPLLGARANVDAVTAAIPGAALAHLAAHGTVRGDNPLFSSLSLSDGPLTVYDLERLSRGADTVVLAACEVGHDVVLAGDELLGLSAAFLARQTRHVVASVLPVPDAATAPLMVSLHKLLAGGNFVAVALAHAQEHIDRSEPAAYAAAAGFVCIGAGFDSLAPHSGGR